MEIVLVRHGQPDWEPDGLAVDDPDLTAHGHAQAARTAERLAGERFDAVYASPLTRVQQTAQPSADTLSMPLVSCSWLREIGMPSLEGHTADQVQDYFREVNAREIESHWDGPTGGESFHHFYERVSTGLEGLLLEDHRLTLHADGAHRLWRKPAELERLLIFAHEGTNSVIVSHLLGLDPIPFTGLRFPSEWAAITRLELRPIAGHFVWTLRAFNLDSHLPALPPPSR